MLLGDLLAHIEDNALDTALKLQRNGFRQTVVTETIWLYFRTLDPSLS
jgi:hypothetical protein